MARLLAMLICVLLAAPALAEDEFFARAQGSRISLQADTWPVRGGAVTTFAVDAQIQVHPRWMLEVELPFETGSLVSFGQGMAFGNVTLGSHGFFSWGRNVTFAAGLSFSIPTHTDVNDIDENQNKAIISRGFADIQRFIPALVVRVPLLLEAHLGPMLFYRGELTVVLVAPRNAPSPQMFEHADELEVRSEAGLLGGVRYQVVVGPLWQIRGVFNGQFEQMAIEPFIGYESREHAVFGRVGLLVGLDNPLGFGFDTNKLASLRVQMGAKF